MTRSVNEYRQVVQAECSARSQLHQDRELLSYSDFEDIGDGGGVVWFGGWDVRSKNQTGVLVDIVTYISSLGAKPRVPVHVFSVEFAGHQDEPYSAESGGPFRSDYWSGRRKVGRKVYHRLAGQSDFNCSSLQVGQARSGH